MSELYTSLHASPRKKRVLSDSDDEATLTPKRLRILQSTPSSTTSVTRSPSSTTFGPDLPTHLARLVKIQTALQHAISHALATSGLAPSTETGIVRNVLDHHSLNYQASLGVRLDVDDLSRLCWLWEWDGEPASVVAVAKSKARAKDDDNPFLEDPVPSSFPKEWTRGSMGFVISPTTHVSKSSQSRVPAYGIGIEIEMDLDKDMGGGMASVARWTAGGEKRRREVLSKIHKWVNVHKHEIIIPNVPMADLPQLISPSKPSNLTRLLASASPSAISSQKILSTPPSPSSFAKKAQKSPSKTTPCRPLISSIAARLSETSKMDVSNVFPQTPSTCRTRTDDPFGLLASRTPSLSPSRSQSLASDSLPSTPVSQRGAGAGTAPQTPSSSRRQALYDRIRDKALHSPSKSPTKRKDLPDSKLSREALLRLSQEEMRRRVLLGRLGSMAESIWMLFVGASGSNCPPTARKRRALPQSEIVSAILKSSQVPISTAEAVQSIDLLTSLCPFFLRPLRIDNEDWLEMPSSAVESSATVHSITGVSRNNGESSSEVLNRSPRRIKREGSGLREVRERIRKELEASD